MVRLQDSSFHRPGNEAEESFLAESERSHRTDPPGKLFLIALGVAGLLALVGFFCGLVQGGNPFVLAIWCGVIGGGMVLLGYGPIAFLIGALGAVSEWFRQTKDRATRE
jgi:hypothetical protein